MNGFISSAELAEGQQQNIDLRGTVGKGIVLAETLYHGVGNALLSTAADALSIPHPQVDPSKGAMKDFVGFAMPLIPMGEP